METGLGASPTGTGEEASCRSMDAAWRRLGGWSGFGRFTSPLQRALETWKLTGSGVVADVDRDLLEWE